MIAGLMRSLLLALLWTSSAALSVAFTRHGGGLATVWFANAILTAFLLIEPRQRHSLYILVTLLLSFLFNLWSGRTEALALALSVAGVGEALIAAALMARLSPADRLFDDSANLLRFALSSVIACVPPAIMMGLVMHGVSGASWWQIAAGWITTHGCGLLIMTPLLIVLHRAARDFRPDRIRPAALGRSIAMLGLVAGTTALVFGQSTYVLSFLIVPALLVPTFLLRAPGAAGSVAIIAIVASWFTIEGSGPFALMPVSAAERVYVMQLFIATMFLCALPIAALLDERDELAARTAAHLANMHGIADRIGDVLFRIDDRNAWAYLNPAYQAVTGRSVAGAIGRPVLADLPQRDHNRFNHALARLRAGRIPHYAFTSQIVDALGVTRYIEFALHAGTFGGQGEGISGVFRDVTARTLIDMQLRQKAVSARRDARTDPLTGLPNRRAFFERLETRMEAGHALALALFDLDHFKRINDAFGHPAGDAVLRHIAAAASSLLKDGEMIARIGGEEFALLIEDRIAGAAVATAERLIAAIASQKIALSPELTGSPEGIGLHMTISMGLARSKPGQAADDLLAEADRALYLAKNSGRNQLKLAA